MSRQLFCHFTFCQQRKKRKKEKEKKKMSRQLFCHFTAAKKKKKKVFWITAIWRPFTQNNASMVLASMTSRGRSLQSLMVLGRNESYWYLVLQCGCQNCWLCLRRSQRAFWWWLDLVLNSITGNDAVVDSVQHCQPIHQIIVIF